MKLHRYFIDSVKLGDELSVTDKQLLRQWQKVLRYAPGREVELFNTQEEQAIYKIEELSSSGARLQKVQDTELRLPSREIYLCFALLKKDKSEWVLQKATELGVSHFMPPITERTEKTGWSSERAQKIVIEASEQCGRSNIPVIHEPNTLESTIDALKASNVEIYIAEQESPHASSINPLTSRPIAVLVGPEGGWSDNEKELFNSKNIQHIQLSNFTLRAETAAITVAALLGETN